METKTNIELYQMAQKKAGRARNEAIRELTNRAQVKTGRSMLTIYSVYLALDLVEPKVFQEGMKMKAKIKTDYFPYKKGDIFDIKEILDQFVSLEINGNKVDFGFKEIEIIANMRYEKMELGRFLAWQFGKNLTLLRNGEIETLKKRVYLPIKKRLIGECLDVYIWDN